MTQEREDLERLADIKRFSGGFLVWRLSAPGYRRKDGGGKRLPHFRHPTREAAETEAARLAGLWPESTFVVIHEISRVKARAQEPRP